MKILKRNEDVRELKDKSFTKCDYPLIYTYICIHIDVRVFEYLKTPYRPAGPTSCARSWRQSILLSGR